MWIDKTFGRPRAGLDVAREARDLFEAPTVAKLDSLLGTASAAGRRSDARPPAGRRSCAKVSKPRDFDAGRTHLSTSDLGWRAGGRDERNWTQMPENRRGQPHP